MPKELAPIEPFDPLAVENVGVTVALELLEQPVEAFPPAKPFAGAGVYVLYYRGDLEAYRPLRSMFTREDGCWWIPLYVGRALRVNARQGFSTRPLGGRELYNRIKAHVASIRATRNLDISDFGCRYLVLNDAYIPLAESVLITTLRPLWNGMGLGSNGTGAPRLKGKASLWDSLHPGRGGRPEGTPEREADAHSHIANLFSALSQPHQDERTAAMIEKIERRSARVF